MWLWINMHATNKCEIFYQFVQTMYHFEALILCFNTMQIPFCPLSGIFPTDADMFSNRNALCPLYPLFEWCWNSRWFFLICQFALCTLAWNSRFKSKKRCWNSRKFFEIFNVPYTGCIFLSGIVHFGNNVCYTCNTWNFAWTGQK